MNSQYLSMIPTWREYLSNKQNVYNFIITFIILIPVLIFLPMYLTHIETRDGFVFTDPLLTLFEPIDLTWWAFSFIYIGLFTAIIHLVYHPKYLLLALKVYTITAIFRIIGMYFLPLEAPENIIPLNDPFVQFWGTGEILTKDLFFSGHTSTMFIFFLTAQNKILKNLFLAATIAIALCVIFQHVHYTIDVFAAPFFAYTSFKIAELIENKFNW